MYIYICIYMNKLIDKMKITHHITDKLVAHHIRDNLVPVAVDIVSPSIVGVISWLSVVKARPGVSKPVAARCAPGVTSHLHGPNICRARRDEMSRSTTC